MQLVFIKGLIIGIAIVTPVGPIGILCIQRSLHIRMFDNLTLEGIYYVSTKC